MTHDLRGEHRKLSKIVKYLQKITCSEIQDFERRAYGQFIQTKTTPAHQDIYSNNSLSFSFGFNEFGRPGVAFANHALSVQIEECHSESRSFKCVLHLGCYKFTVVFGLGYMEVDQIYITIEQNQPNYTVIAIGKTWDICTEKHAEFNLDSESIMYATLCGQTTIRGVSHVVKCFRDIAHFTHIIVDYGIEQRTYHMSANKLHLISR